MTYIVSETGEVFFNVWHRAIVCYLTLRKKQELIEELEGSSGWLMN